MRHVLRRLTRTSSLLLPILTAACVLVVSAFAARVLQDRVMRQAEETIRSAVETAYGVLLIEGGREVHGERSREEAQRRAIESLRALRFERNNYFFVQDLEHRLVMHPFRRDLEGRVNADRLPNGKLLQDEFSARVAGPERAGYLLYSWPRPGSGIPVRKMSFVKLYEPWGWILGAGTYLDDVDAILAKDTRRLYTAASLIAFLLLLGSIGAARGQGRARHLEAELQQARKLEAVGQLAAGIAHEINTPIQFIGDNVRFAGDALADYAKVLARYREAARPEEREGLAQLEEEVDLRYLTEQVPKAIERTLQGVERVAVIVRAMKDFGHPDAKEMVATDLNRSVQSTLEVARNEYKYVADVESDYGEIPAVLCHPGELNQVFLNLIVNAAHAIGDSVQGTGARGAIRIRTRAEDGQVVVAIADTGGGIPDAIRDRIFEPFFTTKEVGRGTGQGLSIARSIVRGHRGSISFETRPGQGTTFFVRLPVREPEPEPERRCA